MTGSSEYQPPQNRSPQGQRLQDAWNHATTPVGLPELAWRPALAAQLSKSWPSAREEEWKYSPISQIQAYQWSPVADEVRFELPEGVEACRMSAVSGSVLDRVKSLMNIPPAHRFNAMAWIMDQDVWVIRVPRGLSPSAPLRVFAPRGSEGSWSCAAWILLVEAEAHLSVVEYYGPQASATSWGARFFLESGSAVEHLRVQSAASDSWGFAESIALVGENARYVQTQISSGGKMCREDAVVRLQGRGAEAHLDAVFMARQEQVLDHRTNIDHEVGDTQSHQLYKGLLADSARGIFNGRILIRRGAVGANAAQLSQNLLLSPQAEINTKPELQIDADDVKAAHGAAVGQLDAEHLFYLQSRGISEEKAKEVLLLGFALEALRGLRDPELLKIGNSQIEAEANLMLRTRKSEALASESSRSGKLP